MDTETRDYPRHTAAGKMNEPWSDCGEGKWWLDNVVKMHVWRGVCLAQCLAFRAAAAAGRPSTAAPAPPHPAPATAGGEGGFEYGFTLNTNLLIQTIY